MYASVTPPVPVLTEARAFSYRPLMRKTVVFGLLGAVAVSILGLGIKLACWKRKPAGVVNTDQIRFGPKNTNTTR